MHKEDADQIPVPRLWAQGTVSDPLGPNAFHVAVQLHQPLHFLAAVDAIGQKGELIRGSGAARPPERVVTNSGRVYQ